MFSAISDEKQRNELEEFYREYQNCFHNTAYLNLHNENDAQDAVQEAFQEIVRDPDNFFKVSPENRVRFMTAVIRNISSDMFKKNNKILLEKLDEEEAYDDNPFSFEDNMIGKVSRDEIKAFIKTLPPLQRDVLTLRSLMGYSTAETAEKLNISQSAIKKRLHLAKDAVREYVRKDVDGASWEKTVNGSSISLANTKSGLASGKYRVKSVFAFTNKQGKTEPITIYSDERSV